MRAAAIEGDDGGRVDANEQGRSPGAERRGPRLAGRERRSAPDPNWCSRGRERRREDGGDPLDDRDRSGGHRGETEKPAAVDPLLVGSLAA
jgi:hypothetical protein